MKVNSFILHIKKAGETVKKIPISRDGTYVLGRGEDCQITINFPELSRNHLSITMEQEQLSICDLGSSNGTFINNGRLEKNQPYLINEDTDIQLSEGTISLLIDLENVSSQTNRVNVEDDTPHSLENENSPSDLYEKLQSNGQLTIGRSPECDLTLPSLQVSRRHATLKLNGSEITIEDLGSTNGTFVNGLQIQASVVIKPTDQITIGATSFYLQSGLADTPYAIVAKNIEKIYSRGFVGLNKMSIEVPSKEFVALMGPSGCGKSTLLKGLNGANPVTSGTIVIQGLELNNNNYNTLKKHIGYVPQDDIVHNGLSVEKTLFYAAKLRMSKDVTNSEIREKIDSVLTSLNLEVNSIKKSKISELSGGQRKRISIAVELLNDPTILFLDEPTSPLDPETIEDFLGCIKGLTRNGQTVIMVTHKPSDLNYVDKVIFLSKGGYQTYYGAEKDILGHFNKTNIIEIYSLMKDPDTGKKWHEKWLEKNPSTSENHNVNTIEPRPRTSFFRQYFWLSARYFNLKINDLWNMALLFGQPVIIAFLLTFMFSSLQISVFFMMAVSAIWFGVSNASKEIVSELAIYERERMYNLNIVNYIASKVTVLSALAFIQVLTFITIIYFSYQPESNEVELWLFWPNVWFMFLLSISATIFGLLLSSVFSNTEKVMTFVPIALMPQIILAGVIAQLDSSFKVFLSYFTLGRWGTEGFAHIQDHGAIEMDQWSDESKSIPASIMQLLPNSPLGSEQIDPSSSAPNSSASAPSIDMVLQPNGAMEQLNFYGSGSKLISLFPENFSGVLSAIFLIIFIFSLSTYFALKLKDKKFA